MQALDQLLAVVVYLLIIAVIILAIIWVTRMILATPIKDEEKQSIKELGEFIENALSTNTEKVNKKELLASIYTELNSLVLASYHLMHAYKTQEKYVSICDELIDQFIHDYDSDTWNIISMTTFTTLAGKLDNAVSNQLINLSQLKDNDYLESLMHTIALRKGEYVKQADAYKELVLNELKPVIDNIQPRLNTIELTLQRNSVVKNIDNIHTQLANMEKSLTVTPLQRIGTMIKR